MIMKVEFSKLQLPFSLASPILEMKIVKKLGFIYSPNQDPLKFNFKQHKFYRKIENLKKGK